MRTCHSLIVCVPCTCRRQWLVATEKHITTHPDGRMTIRMNEHVVFCNDLVARYYNACTARKKALARVEKRRKAEERKKLLQQKQERENRKNEVGRWVGTVNSTGTTCL